MTLTPRPASNWKIPLLIFILGIAAGSIFVFLFRSPAPYGNEYEDIAKFIAQGKGYIGPGFFKYSVRPTSFLMPLYTYLLAMFFTIFGDKNAYLAIYFLQVLSFSGTAVLLYLITKKLFSSSTAFVSTMVFFIYLPIYYTALQIWDTSFLILAITLSAYLYFQIMSNFKPITLVMLASFLGLSIYINPVSMVLIPSCMIHYGIFGIKKHKMRLMLALVFIPLLILLPWTVRNYLVHRSFIPTRTGLGLNLYLGNNEAATGTVFLKINGEVPPDLKEGITHNFRPLVHKWIEQKATEAQEERELGQLFIDFVFRHPLKFIRLLFVKTYYFWWRNPFQKDPLDAFQPVYALIMLFSLVYAMLKRTSNVYANFFYLVFFFFTATYAITGPFFNWKYRYPIEPLLIILCAGGLELFFKTTRTASRSSNGISFPAKS